MNRLSMLNNCKIKHKLLIIYIFCVCIPMLITDGVIIGSIRRNALEQQSITMDNMIDRIAYNVKLDIEGCNSIANNLYTDSIINTFLETNHKSNLNYYINYKQLIQNNIFKYYYKSQNINNIMLYVDNHTIMNGGSFWQLDDVRDMQWYKDFKESNEDTLLMTYFDEKKASIARMSRTISVIKKLNYLGSRDKEKIVKIDLEYTGILNKLLNEKIEGYIYICNDKYILFSNKITESSLKNFTPKERLEIEGLAYEKTFNVGSDYWTVYIVPAPIKILSMIRANRAVIWLMAIVNLLLPTIIISIISKSFTQRISMIEAYLDKVKREDFQVITDVGGRDEIGSLIKSYNLMVIKIRDLIEVVLKKNAEKQALELARKEAELKALQTQVNPHFMFNTLESIRMRSLLKHEDETAKVIGQLAIILRKSLSWRYDNISIKEEITFVEQYTNIQKYRFGDKLNFGFYIMPGCEGIKIPKLSILTFVENACVHGIEGISDRGNIFVTISKDEENLYIEISDSGCGMNEEKLNEIRNRLSSLDINRLSQSKSTGMLNALIRMKLCTEGRVEFQIESEEGQGTDISLQLAMESLENL
ncbi:sensor histidine kinase [Cellulosilyticum ruminicola]|uniref:sensor histidine kinase n=1 Tax=Cellulosilyticum ruminicola TaxID=425254 RepID=UPI0006D177DA|nr:histidine kinase [Cellulosilyticum ruminicola]